MNKQNQNNESSPLAEIFPALFKFGLGVGVKMATLAIDEAGSLLGLDVEKPGIFGFKKSVPISEQSVSDILNNLKSLGTKLQDPRVKQEIQILIQQLEPIVQDAANRLVDIATNSLKLGLKDAVALACEVPPISVFCGMSKVAESGANFIADVGKSGDELLEQKKMGEALIDDTRNKINSFSSMKPNYNQRGGLKKIRGSTKSAIKRINKSLNAFYKSNKTKRHRSK
jgi:hypothetical protein